MSVIFDPFIRANTDSSSELDAEDRLFAEILATDNGRSTGPYASTGDEGTLDFTRVVDSTRCSGQWVVTDDLEYLTTPLQ